MWHKERNYKVHDKKKYIYTYWNIIATEMFV